MSNNIQGVPEYRDKFREEAENIIKNYNCVKNHGEETSPSGDKNTLKVTLQKLE